MEWQRELDRGRELEARRENAVLPPRTPMRVMFDEHGTLVGSIPEGVDAVVHIQRVRLS